LDCIVVHTLPHVPQFFGSVILFVQEDPEELPEEPLDAPLEPEEPDPLPPLLEASSPPDASTTVPSGPASPMLTSEKPQRLAQPAPKTAIPATAHGSARILTRSPED
jgi:hypothetical protein